MYVTRNILFSPFDAQSYPCPENHELMRPLQEKNTWQFPRLTGHRIILAYDVYIIPGLLCSVCSVTQWIFLRQSLLHIALFKEAKSLNSQTI
jgi:hypothetical protein